MIKETYERLLMDVTEFDVEDIITTSGEDPHTDPVLHTMHTGRFEQGINMPLGF